jgi:predicted PurR-regulated permease PerM
MVGLRDRRRPATRQRLGARWHRRGSRPRHAFAVDPVQIEARAASTSIDGSPWDAGVADGAGRKAEGARRREVAVLISIRTILLAAVVVAVGAALGSIRSVLLLIFVSVFTVAVLSPVAAAMERRLGWSRRLCSIVLMLAIGIVIAGVALVMVQAASSAVRGLSHDLPQIADQARHSDLGNFVNARSGSLDALTKHTGEITAGAGKVSGGVAQIGVSAFGAVTLVFSVIFLTLFGLIEEPHLRKAIGSLMYRDTRERYVRITDRIVRTTSRYMLGNIAISVVCGTVYGVTAAILGLPYPLALAVTAAILDLVPNVGATLAGAIMGIVALSVSLEALIVSLVVIVVYQQIENYVLQPTIIGKAAQISGFTVLASVLAFGALFGLIGAIIGVPIAAALQIVVEELTAGRRARIAAADAAEGPGRA